MGEDTERHSEQIPDATAAHRSEAEEVQILPDLTETFADGAPVIDTLALPSRPDGVFI